MTATKHEFCREQVDDDGSSLYTSFRYVIGNLDGVNNKSLRLQVADRIRGSEKLHSLILESNTKYKTVKDYCNQIEKGNLSGGKVELHALAMLGKLVIRVVSITTTAEDNVDIKVLAYGEHAESYKECVYILYDEEKNHYDPLYVINKENLNEKSTIFQRYDQMVSNLLDVFIQKEINGCYNMVYEKELPTGIHLLNETEKIDKQITPSGSTNLSEKRKLPDHAGLSFTQILAKELSGSKSNYNDVSDKPTKFAKWNMAEKPIVYDNNCQPLTIEQYLQTDFSLGENYIAMIQQPTTDFSMMSPQNYPEAGMKFEVELALEFRGRTPGDFKPKKENKRNGQPAEARPPRYFPDRNNHPYFNLLIPERYLSPNVEYCFKVDIVTREIHGCTYIHPYFKFQVHPTDENIPDENPRSIPFDPRKLQDHSEGIKQLLLQFVVVMHTNPQLMQSEQPLPIFCSSTNASPITTKYDKQCAFKSAYHLRDLRFAVTLWKRQPSETDFHQCDGIQYISQISTENKNTKIRD